VAVYERNRYEQTDCYCSRSRSTRLGRRSHGRTGACSHRRNRVTDGGAEQLVLQTIGEARKSIRVMAYTFTSRTVVASLVAAALMSP